MFVALEGSAEFDARLKALSQRGDDDLLRVEPAVRAIVDEVRARGDSAVREFTERFEQRQATKLVWSADEISACAAQLPTKVRDHLRQAADRIAVFHQRQKETGFSFVDDSGITLGTSVRPLASVGVYAPGGKARYPSSVLMAAVPAKVAGVSRIVLATPNPTPEICAAAELSGVTTIYDAGGAQAIAALAYGTESLTRVDKIVGPGNIYVACAKRLVFGTVDIDGIAGPSEILVICDASANPEVVAADLLSQAEHDEEAYALVLVCASDASQGQRIADSVRAALERQLALLPRREIAAASIANNAAALVVVGRANTVAVANVLAAEHVSLQLEDAESWADEIVGGALFIGHDTPEAAGDYAAGPSHVLPTGGAARYASPLGVYEFMVRSSRIRYTRTALAKQRDLLTALARLEGLEAHARAVEVRLATTSAKSA